MKQLTSCELHTTIHAALEEASRRLASGELDGSGRFYSDAELAAGAATGKIRNSRDSADAPAA